MSIKFEYSKYMWADELLTIGFVTFISDLSTTELDIYIAILISIIELQNYNVFGHSKTRFANRMLL